MSYIDKYITLFLEMLAIPALSRDEADRASLLEKWMKAEGLAVKRSGNNLLVSGKRASGKPGLLLCSHIDTVPPVKGWQKDPFTPIIHGNQITALGANDAGASVIAMLAAFMMLLDTGGTLEPFLLLCAEEEISGKGGLEMMLPELKDVRLALVGEPTGMQPAVAQRGLMVVDAIVRGESGHAARNEGKNAIMLAMEEIRKIADLRFAEKSAWLPEPSLQVTMIQAGTAHNVVPDECRFVIDVRSNDRYNNAEILTMLQDLTTAELQPRSTRLKATRLSDGHPLHEVFHKMGYKAFGSLTLSDMALLPFPSVKIGPGDSARSHTAGEWITINEIQEGMDGYVAIGRKILSLDWK
ncbi:MAG: M20/M25/M40 family metallo-hydrolase [Bacteroidota bacterium]